jgi:hypothetical protein
MRLFRDPAIAIADQMPPRPGRVARRERIGPDLINVVMARRQMARDLARSVDSCGRCYSIIKISWFYRTGNRASSERGLIPIWE